MGISRDSIHKKRKTGGRRTRIRMKRKFEMGRQPSNTRIGEKRIHLVRTRGGNQKFRALRLDTGNFTWASEGYTKSTRIIEVVYNATSNELVRTNTLVKGAIVVIDSTPYKQWYAQHYGVTLGKTGAVVEDSEASRSVQRKLKKRQSTRTLDESIEHQFKSGRLYARISSRPGQCGRADGYILEGEELAFYLRKLDVKKKKN
eukprot:TRINITY_DN1395_c0_g1_i1.p1 TRINITY_DN1395_c0_g1~~TRINITY_DN1395_c0_g1_i1.p1  ORF type:complete len:202 (+),score=41.63 TRINITY_DN1395_c0_g1_i1:96-701(+)